MIIAEADPLPFDFDAEKGILGSFLTHPKDVLPKLVDVSAEFFSPTHGSVFTGIKSVVADGNAVDVVTVVSKLKEVDGCVEWCSVIAELANAHGTPGNVGSYVNRLKLRHAQRCAQRFYEEVRQEGFSVESMERLHDRTGGILDSLKSETSSLLALLDARRFDIKNPPPAANPVWWIDRQPIATPGNLVGIQSQAKGGKSALTTAMLAAIMQPQGDCLGVTGTNHRNGAILHFDTEQSPNDHAQLVKAILHRVGIDEPPPCFYSYYLVDVPLTKRFQTIIAEMQRRRIDHGSIAAVVIDGAADLLLDTNDMKESLAMVENLHSSAVQFYCPIVCVIHENPGVLGNGKTRGHFGSQLERKAETNIRLDKDPDGVTTVYFDKARHGFLPKSKGLRFAWSEELKMHVSIETAEVAKEEAKRKQLDGIMARIFQDRISKSHKDLVAAVMKETQKSERTAKEYITQAVDSRIIRKDLGGYYELITT